LINLVESGTKAARCSPHAPALIDAQRGKARTFAELSGRVYDKPYQSIVDQFHTVVDARTWVYWEPGRESGYEELLSRVAGAGVDPGAGPALGSGAPPEAGSLLRHPFLAVSAGGTMGIPKSTVRKQFSCAACTLTYLAAARITPTDVQHSREFSTWERDGYVYLAERAKNGMPRKFHSPARPKNQHVC